MAKHKIILQTNAPWLKTGLAENGRILMKYLAKTGKYDLLYYCTQTSIADPTLGKMPYRSVGCIPANQQEINELQRDQGRWRDICYGSHYIDKIVKDEKPTIWLGSDDIWSFGPQYYNAEWFKKINSILHITIDSRPILEQAYEQARATKHFHSWARFAIPEMAKNNTKIDCIYGASDTEKFKPVTPLEKANLRAKFGIPDNELIFIYLGRNQLRKEFGNIIQAFAKFKKEFPNVKSKLLFHTSFSERGNGWDIPMLLKYAGLKNEDILCTMVCRNCGQWEVKPYAGEDTDCRYCGAQKSQISANIQHGVPDDELYQIYGIADASISAFTSGGLEFHNVNSLLCGLPLACTNYSSGEDFCEQPFVYPINWHYRLEAGTNFIKATNDTNSICNFMRKIHTSSTKDRQELSEMGRSWAKKEFSIETIGAKWEKLFDSMPMPDWSTIELTVKPKNPNFANPSIEGNMEWVKTLYREILNMNVADDDKGLVGWLSQLKNGISRNDIYTYFIKVANDENAKNAPPRDFGTLLDDNGRKRILAVMKESGGDIFILTSTFKDLKRIYPDADLYVALDPKFAEILDGNPYVYKVLPYHPAMEQEMAMMGYVDYYYHPGIVTQRQLAYLTKDKIGLNLENKTEIIFPPGSGGPSFL